MNTANFWFFWNLYSFFQERKGEKGAELFSVVSGYSDVANDVVDVRVQKDYNSLGLMLIEGLDVFTY